MPVIKVQHVCSASSEDPGSPADNLIALEEHKKWSSSSGGEAKAVVVLQLEKSSQINAVDIGNNGAAFVELLVGRSTSPDHYEPLVAMTSFMTPKESKQWANTNRVKIFDQNSLSKEIAAQKWDRVKLVCTQPYNKSEKYGVSFVKLHSPPEESKTAGSDPSRQPGKLGAFSLKADPKDLPPGTMFHKKAEKTPPPNPPVMNAAAEARKASMEALSSFSDSSSPGQSRGGVSGHTGRPDRPTASPKAGKRSPSRTSSDSPSAKRSKVEDKRPFSRLLEGAVFALSGFKNPLRAELRQKGVDIGALYQADWDDTCTHLVCAFPNTPKFNQVKGKGGLIVSKDWLVNCHSRKIRLPAKNYQLAPGDGVHYDTKEAAIFKQLQATDSDGRGKEDAPSEGQRLPDSGKEASRTSEDKSSGEGGVKGGGEGGVASLEDVYGASTDEESDNDGEVRSKPEVLHEEEEEEMDDDTWRQESLESDCDTEDEVERIREREKAKAGGDGKGGSGTIKDSRSAGKVAGHTPAIPSRRSLLDLPDFFSSVIVFLYGSFSASDRRTLLRYITAYGGRLVGYMEDAVTHVVTQQQWDDNFDQALVDNSRLSFVHPKWIFACHQKKQLVPHQTFAVVPT